MQNQGFACVAKPVRWAAPPTCSRSVSPWEKHLARDFQSPGARYQFGIALGTCTERTPPGILLRVASPRVAVGAASPRVVLGIDY
ncbi:MAG: hypothetical protein V7K97_07540 [Nostoc sp.]|uniref:hypothetical protein n=1 Tax=Nostoc sp. TaxID=1180 RepID=UPI002FFAD724